MKRMLTAVCLATGLLVSPVGTGLNTMDVGVEQALARECAVEVELCQEINLVFYKTQVCYKFGLFCD